MRDYLDHALRDAGKIEIRHHVGDRWQSGIFDDVFALRQVVRDVSVVGNVYSTLNAPGDVPVTNEMRGRALSDEHIDRVVRIPFDFDPVRPKGAPSTDAELDLARARRNRLSAALSAIGWPAPAVATSGNGAHALYRCRLPNDASTREMLAAVYRGLKADFGDDHVAFDTTVRNPGRIWRLYGTVNRKGLPTADRPHRLSKVIIPARWEAVSPRQLDALATKYAKAPTQAATTSSRVVAGSGDYRTLDIVAWMSANGLYKRPLGQGKHAVRCPWESEHSTPDTPLGSSTVVWEPDPGLWPTWHCSHDHCAGRSIVNVMQRLGDADRFCAVAWRAAS